MLCKHLHRSNRSLSLLKEQSRLREHLQVTQIRFSVIRCYLQPRRVLAHTYSGHRTRTWPANAACLIPLLRTSSSLMHHSSPCPAQIPNICRHLPSCMAHTSTQEQPDLVLVNQLLMMTVRPTMSTTMQCPTLSMISTWITTDTQMATPSQMARLHASCNKTSHLRQSRTCSSTPLK